jgi:hypothetical protein
MSCAKHELRRWDVSHMGSGNWHRGMAALLDGRFADVDEDGEEVRYHWCSVCVNLATWECVSMQEDMAGASVKVGCGLLLCDLCAVEVEAANGDLQSVVRKLEESDGLDQIRPRGLRADVNFLREDGIMEKFLSKRDEG